MQMRLSIRALGWRGLRLLASLGLLLVCVGLTLARGHIASWLGLAWLGTPVAPMPVAGLFVESGWMGDAAAVTTRPMDDVAPDGSPAQEWVYRPGRGRLGWAAVAYQHPENNFGDRPGRDLSGRGFTRVTFWARGEGGRVCFKSGGHTRPGAAYPASHECSLGVVVLTPAWREYALALPPGCDLRNVAAVFAFSLEERLWPAGGAFQLAGITVR